MDNKEWMHWTMQSWSTSIESLAHKLVTQLVALQFKEQRMNQVMPILLKAYTIAEQQQLLDEKINPQVLREVDELQDLDEQLNPMFDLLEGAVDRCMEATRLNKISMARVSAEQCLTRILSDDLFVDEAQRRLIEIHLNQNFEFLCPINYFETALRHLLHLALQRTTSMHQESIQISAAIEEKHYVFYIKDSGFDLTYSLPSELFNHFFFEPYDTTRPGLGLCRLVLWGLGGDIQAHMTVDKSVCAKIILPAH